MAYRTTSVAAIQVIIRVPPIDLLADERHRIHKRADGHTEVAKRQERDETYKKWQNQWKTQEETGAWTRKIIKDVRTWAKCTHRTTEHLLTQTMTGHGNFGSYTKRIKNLNAYIAGKRTIQRIPFLDVKDGMPKDT